MKMSALPPPGSKPSSKLYEPPITYRLTPSATFYPAWLPPSLRRSTATSLS
jgi:hypothetical protein